MGYESKCYIGSRYKRNEESDGMAWFDKLAVFNLSTMGYEKHHGKYFSDIFKTEIDFPIGYTEDGNGEPIFCDCYGTTCKYASVEEVIKWLDGSNVVREYLRAKVFYDFLLSVRGFDLIVVHYGY